MNDAIQPMISPISLMGAAPTERVSTDVKKEYDDLLNELSTILSKAPPFDALDSQQLETCLTKLKGLQTAGIETNMDTFLKALFYFTEGVGADPSNNKFVISPDKMEALSIVPVTINNNSMTLVDALKAAADPTYNPNATKTLGDMLLDFSRWGYDMYTSQLKDLKTQIDVATQSINDLKALQDILNMVTVVDGGNYKNPPDNWDQIPKEIQDKFRAQFPELFTVIPDPNGTSYYDKLPPNLIDELYGDVGFTPFSSYVLSHNWSVPPYNELSKYVSKDLFNKVTAAVQVTSDGPPSDFSKIKNWIKDNGSTYSNWSDDYFKKEIGIRPDPQPDAATVLNQLLATRDDLQAQLKILAEGSADQGEGSPYASITNVLKDIEKLYPTSTYPPGAVFKTGTAYTEVDALAAVSTFINAGQNKTQGISNNLDKAVTANQNLSSKMSDEIKAKNLTLQTMFDILTQIQDALNKNITGAAQKINR